MVQSIIILSSYSNLNGKKMENHTPLEYGWVILNS